MRRVLTVIVAGLISGCGAALWTLFEYAMGWHNEHLETGGLTGFVAIIVPIAAIVWALRAIKRANAGHLTLLQAMICGLSVSAISAAIGVAFFSLYYSRINPAFVDAMAARGQAVDVPAQLIAVAVGSLFLGGLVSAMAGLLMRTRGGTAR